MVSMFQIIVHVKIINIYIQLFIICALKHLQVFDRENYFLCLFSYITLDNASWKIGFS